ncbi:MAG: DUF1579 domain-containing protein [Phycisphaerales bacterium]|jgi:hypothetical protein
MNCPACLVGIGAIAAITLAGSIALAQNTTAPPARPATPPAATPPAGTRPAATPPATTKPAAPAAPAAPAGGHEMKLPPGMTEADMQACMAAAVPGPMHAKLAEGVGVWNGKNTMWATPQAEPTKSDSVCTISPMMDGRFFKCEWAGEMPGMGPFNGFSISGFDNTAQKFQSTWIDNFGTGMMIGTGDLSSDGKTMTWTYGYTCPITKKPTTMREIHRITGKDTRTMEMFAIDPASGKEFKMLEVQLTRKPSATASR